MKRFAVGQRVIVNTGGEDTEGIVEARKHWNPALADSVCVAFGNGTGQWIPKKYIKAIDEGDAAFNPETTGGGEKK